MFLRVVGPIGFDRIPEILETLFVGIAVLHDEGGDALGMSEGEAPAYGRAIIHDIHCVTGDTELVEKTVDQLPKAIEGVGKGCPVGHVALPEARVIGGNDVIAICELRDQISEHV
jgi:hypothetical protein